MASASALPAIHVAIMTVLLYDVGGFGLFASLDCESFERERKGAHE